MKINTNEIETLLFYPEDGSLSWAVKIRHHPTGREYICDEFQSQVENRRECLKMLIVDLSSKFKNISIPKYLPFDQIKTLHPSTDREGYIREIIWHFKDNEWNYFIESENKKISKRYVENDLSRFDT